MDNPRTADHPIDDLFLSRWSSRAFDATEIAEGELLKLLEAARWAPSASNIQPWRFVYGLRGDEVFAALAGTLMPGNALWAPKAAALVAIASAERTTPASGGESVPNASHAFDAGAAWALLALQAEMSGWASHAMAGFDKAKAAVAIKMPSDHVLHAMVAIGRRGAAETLPEPLQAREAPSGRRPLGGSAFHGGFPPAE